MMEKIIVYLSTDEGRLSTWGIFTRAFALTLSLILFSFAYQLPSLSGRNGLAPLCDILSRYRRDFGFVKSLWYWPTLFWVTGSSDFALQALPCFGAVAALCAAWGGAYASPLGLIIAWATLLSIDAGPSACVYPWDSLSLEAAFLALWLPGTQELSVGIAALSLPSPLLAVAYRWLLFRVLVGFGKLKFVGAGWNDRFYIRGFLIGQPMISPAGWAAYHFLPESAWVFLLGGMFFTEIIAPFGLFFTGIPRVAAAVSIIGLMGGIQLSGNFGYFNILTSVLCIPSLDATSNFFLFFSQQEQTPLDTRTLTFIILYIAYIFPVSLLQFVMNSWINLSWAHWSGVYRLRLPMSLKWSQFYARALKELGHFRVVSAYGVFPPAASPAQRWALCYEGSTDGHTWQRYEMQYYISSTRTPPRFIAPWHPRVDHALFYESFGSSGSPMAVLGHNNPYSFHVSANAWVRLQLRLLKGGDAARAVAPFFRVNPFPDVNAPPRHVRVIICQFLPTTLEHWRRTGDWWHESYMGVAHASISLDSLRAAQINPKAPLPARLDDAWPLNDSAPKPEDFWVEFYNWRERAGVSCGVINAADIEDAWAFMAELRVAAAHAVLELCGGGTASSVPSKTVSSTCSRKTQMTNNLTSEPSPPAASARRQSSPTRRRRGDNNSVPTRSSPPPSPKLSATSLLLQRDPLESVALTHSRSFVRLPFNVDIATAAAKRVITAAHKGGEISRADVDAVFIWAALPGTVARIRSGRTMASLTHVRSTLNLMSSLWLRGAARVFDRPVPTPLELIAELASCVTPISPYARASWSHIGDMITGKIPDVSAAVSTAAGQPLNHVTDGAPLFHFAGNDDARTAGAMKSPLRWLMHAHRVMLEGGPRIWKAAAIHLGGGLPLDTRVQLDVGTNLNSLSPPTVWDALCVGGRFDPSTMSTEAGSFLLWTLDFDALSSAATAFNRVASQSRPPRTRPTTDIPTFLPAMLDFVPRIHAHPELRAAHVPHASGGKESGDFQTSASVPDWCLSQDEATWTPKRKSEQ